MKLMLVKPRFRHQPPVIKFLVTNMNQSDISLLLQLREKEMAFLKMSISEANFTFELFDC